MQFELNLFPCLIELNLIAIRLNWTGSKWLELAWSKCNPLCLLVHYSSLKRLITAVTALIQYEHNYCQVYKAQASLYQNPPAALPLHRSQLCRSADIKVALFFTFSKYNTYQPDSICHPSVVSFHLSLSFLFCSEIHPFLSDPWPFS